VPDGVSPYSRKGHVHHDGPYDHTSILRFIEWRWGPRAARHPGCARRRTSATAFDFSQSPHPNIGIRQMEGGAYLSTNLDVRDSEHDEGGTSMEALPLPSPPDDFTVLAEHLSRAGVHIPSFTLPELLGLPSAIPGLDAASAKQALTPP
jgi:hypothetical protein